MCANQLVQPKTNTKDVTMAVEQELIDMAIQAVTKAASEVMRYKSSLRCEIRREEDGKEVKLLADQVTNDILLKALKTSGISILSEETGVIDGTFDSKLQWVVDPIDGSVNFLRGIGYCGISVGLCDDGHPIAGVIYDFNRDELVTGAIWEHKAFANKKEITPSACTDISKAILTTGFPARMSYEKDNITNYVGQILKFNKVRMLGSAVQSCLHVADGRMDAYFEKDVMLWDIAAGLAIIEAAGGFWRWKEGSREYARVIYACAPGLKSHPALDDK